MLAPTPMPTAALTPSPNATVTKTMMMTTTMMIATMISMTRGTTMPRAERSHDILYGIHRGVDIG